MIPADICSSHNSSRVSSASSNPDPNVTLRRRSKKVVSKEKSENEIPIKAENITPPTKVTDDSPTIVNIDDIEDPNEWIKKPMNVYIGRTFQGGSIFGNPFPAGDTLETRIESINKFRNYILDDDQADLLAKVESLRGCNLMCHCAPLPCHGDVYKELVSLRPKPNVPEKPTSPFLMAYLGDNF